MTKGVQLEWALLSVGPGWAGILKELYAKLPKDTYVTTVKEKLGGLRFYTGGISERTADLIDKAEEQSEHTCEICGKEGEILERQGWYSCRCKKHAEGKAR